MIDLSLMSRQEKIIILALLLGITIIIFMMFTPDKVRNERKDSARPQNILVGGGAPGKDRGHFNTPKDIAVDGSGNIYIVDSNNHRVQKFNSNGIFTLSWGGETTDGENSPPPGTFKAPCGIDVAEDGTVYVADTWNGRVQVFSETGNFIMEVRPDEGLWGPRDVAVDSQKNIYIADTGNGKIEKFGPQGSHIGTFGEKGGGTGPGEFLEPFGMKVGKDKLLYVADRKNFRVQALTLDGKFVREFKVDGWNEAQVYDNCLMEPYLDIDDERKRVYIADSANHRVLRYDLRGRDKKVINTDKKGMKFNCPVGVAFMNPGQVLVTDHSAGRVITITDK